MTTAKTAARETREGLTEKARDIWLAGLGLFSTVEEEGEKLFNKFIERGRDLEAKGETFEKKAREKVTSLGSYVTERAGKFSDDVSAKVSDSVPGFVEEKFHSALETFGVSSRKEVQELNEKVDKLTETVDVLVKKLEESGRATPKPKQMS